MQNLQKSQISIVKINIDKSSHPRKLIVTFNLITMERKIAFILCFGIRKIASIFFSLIFLLQSCVIYDKRPVSIDEVLDNKKVKVITRDSRKSIYEKIYYREDGNLYGLTTKKDKDTQDIMIPLDQIDIVKAGTDPNISKDIIKTTEGKTYRFDTYYQENDTIYGKMTIKRQKEVLLLKEDIKGIYPYNPKKSTAGTVFLVIGMIPTGIILISTIVVIIECWGEDCSMGWGGI